MSNSLFLSHHHILIDHCKQNKRIVAQQGAFVLFTGDSPVPIPYYQMCGIRISKNAKAKIRDELRYLFGIYTGSVYPEVELMQEEIKARCLRLNAYDPSLKGTTDAALADIQEEYDYFANCCDYYVRKKETVGELVRFIEKNIVIHKQHLKAYWKKLQEAGENECATNAIDDYNDILNGFINDLPNSIKSIIDSDVQSRLGDKDNENETKKS